MIRVITRADVPEYVKKDFSNSKDIISLELVDKAKLTDAKTGDFVIVKEVVETSRIDTKEYINSFADEVGIEAVMRQFGLTNDPSVFIQRKRASLPVDEDGKEPVQDYSILPDSEEEAIKVAAAAKAAYKNLPPELVNNRSFMEFAETCTEAELNAYIATLKGDDNNE